eukprot:7376104-Prymnesium_polylepis.2
MKGLSQAIVGGIRPLLTPATHLRNLPLGGGIVIPFDPDSIRGAGGGELCRRENPRAVRTVAAAESRL